MELASFDAGVSTLHDRGKRAAELPGMEERRPVHIRNQVGDRNVGKDPAAPEHRFDRFRPAKVGSAAAGDGELEEPRPTAHGTAPFVLLPPAVFVYEGGRLRPEQSPNHPRGARGVGHVNDGARTRGGDPEGGVARRSGGAPDQQGQRNPLPFHLGGEAFHLIQGWGDEAGQADQIGALFPGRVENPVGGHHDPQVLHPIAVACEDDADDALADVVDVPLHRGQHNALPWSAGLL